MLETPLPAEEQIKQAAFAVADQYLRTVKHWMEEEYSLETIRVEGDPNASVVILDAVYVADANSSQRGGGKSVQLAVDLRKQKVVRELAYQ